MLTNVVLRIMQLPQHGAVLPPDDGGLQGLVLGGKFTLVKVSRKIYLQTKQKKNAHFTIINYQTYSQRAYLKYVILH